VVGSILGAHWAYKRIAIADPIKEATATIFNLNREQLWGDLRDLKLETGITPREAFQRVGDGVRKVAPNFWVDHFTQRVSAAMDLGERVVCTDVRTEAEFGKVRELGGAIWLITRPGAGAPGNASLHDTEIQLATLPFEIYDAVIVNDAARVTLEERCEAALCPHGGVG
jgi:hypothetical protein